MIKSRQDMAWLCPYRRGNYFSARNMLPRSGLLEPGVRADAPANGFNLAIVVAAGRSTGTLGLLVDGSGPFGTLAG